MFTFAHCVAWASPRRGFEESQADLLYHSEATSVGPCVDLILAATQYSALPSMAGLSSEAAAEFQKLLDHPGVVLYEPIAALAHLQIARAYALEAQSAKVADAAAARSKARAAYQDFLTLWKDADPDILVLKQAKAEYAKLK